MAATLAGVCQVPLTAVLLLFELTQDYRIVLPLLGAVGMSSWVTSGQTRRSNMQEKVKVKRGKSNEIQQPYALPSVACPQLPSYTFTKQTSDSSNLCEIESSLCIDDSNNEIKKLEKTLYVSEAMRTRYVTITMNTLLTEAVSLMLIEKQPCAVIIDNENILLGLLTLKDIQEFGKYTKGRSRSSKVTTVCIYNLKLVQLIIFYTFCIHRLIWFIW